MLLGSETHDESLPLRGLHALAPWAWRLLIAAVVLLAVYVAAGRYLMSQLPALRDPILTELNERLPFAIRAESIWGGWSAFSPEIGLRSLQIEQVSAQAPPIVLRAGSLRVDVPASLASRTLQLSRLEVRGLALDARLSAAGTIEIVGFEGGNGNALSQWLNAFLPNVERVTLIENRLRLEMPSGEVAEVTLDLSFEREGNTRVLQGLVRSEEIVLAVNADGVGNPLKPLSWTGDIFVDAQSGDLAALDSLWGALDWPFSLAGKASAQFWLTRASGDSDARVHFESESVQVRQRDGAWDLPLDALSFDAALEQRARHWHLLAENFHVEREAQVLDLDRVQFDWWGEALRVRLKDLNLDAIPTVLATAPGLPQGLRDAMPELAPAGQLRAVELRLNDLANPAQAWELRAAVDELAISSYRNSPALSGVGGYLALGPGEGSLHLDSPGFSMHFPSVYREPMSYSDALGELRFAWDSEMLEIESGLLQLSGEEGDARGLLGIKIPFEPTVTGVELGLLIGLVDSHVEHRNKYLPYRLPEPLLDWLDRSVLSGDVRQAGFIWRGSVKPKNRPHMTVQLFLEAENARLAYDPSWPVVEGLSAQVWVDDRYTWALANTATSSGANLSDIAVAALPIDGGVNLNVDGKFGGGAAAGVDLIRNSPLRSLTNSVFDEWAVSGDMSGGLNLSLDITAEVGPPQIALQLNLNDVDALVSQVELALQQVEGELYFNSDRGFLGTRLSGETLGGHFTAAELAQADGSDNAILSLDLEMEANNAGVIEWLDLPLMNFAQGQSTFSGRLLIAGEDRSSVTLESDLVGIALDVPRPFGKSASQALPLKLNIPLRENPTLEVALGERLRMALELDANELSRMAAAVGGKQPDLDVCDQRYCLSGTLSALDISAWDAFYEEYLASAEAEAGTEGPAFTYRVDSLSVGDFALGEHSFGEARIDLWGADTLWQGALESASIQGALSRQNEELHLLVEYFELESTGEGDSISLADLRSVVPSMRVDILELRQDGVNIGHVGFDLDMEHMDGGLYATNVDGELFGLNLSSPQSGALRWIPNSTPLELAYGVSAGAPVAERTEIEFDLSFDDFGQVLSAAGFAPTIESESGTASLRLGWPGTPTEFSTQASDGVVRLFAENGRLFESRPGALALISFLNLAEILRGLSLTHMFESGIPFLTATSELRLHEGMLEVVDLQIDGAASAFAFNGLSDLEAQSINGELVVTLPVANNLPWVAALAAGLPVAAGVFVVSKVFEKQVNRMSSAVYGVSGDIEEPAVEFRRLFDDQLTPTTVDPVDNGTGDD